MDRTSCIMRFNLLDTPHSFQSKWGPGLTVYIKFTATPHRTRCNSLDYPITIWSFKYYGIRRCVVRKVVPSTLSGHSAFIFWVSHSKKVTRSWRLLHFELSWTIHPTTQCHVPENLNLWQHHLENLKTCVSITYLQALRANYALHRITP